MTTVPAGGRRPAAGHDGAPSTGGGRAGGEAGRVGAVRGTVVIATERCKACDLCIPACPPRVLEMSQTTNALGFHFPLLHDGCTGCAACADVCPDFVFEVWRYS